MSGWWRRNRWGLVGLAPAITLAMALPVHDAIRPAWDRRPHTPVTAGADGWVSYAGARIRLTSLTRARLTDYGGAAVDPPAGTAAWHAVVAFRGSAPVRCDLLLEDTDGATYSADPSELTDAGADVGFATCAPDPAPASGWTVDAYFITPDGKTPAALRVVVAGALPRFARLTPP